MTLKENYYDDQNINSPIIYMLSTGMIQGIVEQHIGRLLKDIELERMHHSLVNNETEMWEFTDFVMKSAEDAVDNTDNRWADVDKGFLARKAKSVESGYKRGSKEL